MSLMRRFSHRMKRAGSQFFCFHRARRGPVSGWLLGPAILLAMAHGCASRFSSLPPTYHRAALQDDLEAICGGARPATLPFLSATATRLILVDPRGRNVSSDADAPPGSDLSLVDTALERLSTTPEEAAEGPALEVLTLPCPVSSSDQARTLGTRLEADLVVWTAGTGDAPTPLKLTLLERQHHLRDEGISRWAWGEVAALELPGGPGPRAEWVAQALMGLHLYRIDRSRPAAARLEQALQGARESGVTGGLYALNGALGWTRILAGSPLAAQAALRLAEEEARAAGDRLWEAHTLRALADVAALRGDFGEARRRYDAALELYSALSDAQGEADCLVGRADLQGRLSDTGEARKLYQRALQTYQQLGALDREAGVLKGLGDVALWTCDYPEAERCFIRAQERYRDLQLPVGEALTLKRLGDVRLWLSDPTGAMAHYEQALALYRSQGDRSWEADVLMSLGHARHLEGETSKARALYEEAVSRYRELNDEVGQGHALRALGDILSFGTTYDDARFYYEQAIRLYKAQGNLQGEAACLRGLAYLERSFGVGYARRQYESALFLSRKAGDRLGEAHSRLGLGQLAVARTDYLEARQNFDRARALYRDAGYVLGEARSLLGLSEAAWGLREGSSAQVFFEEARRLYRAAGLKQGEMQGFLTFGQAAMRAAELRLASSAFESALKLARELKDRQAEADVLLLQARLNVRQEKPRDAARGFERVREIYRSLGVTRNLAIATADLGTVLLGLGEGAKGKTMLEEASTLFEQIGMNGEADSCRSLIVAPSVLDSGPVGAR